MAEKSNIAAWARFGLVAVVGLISCALVVSLWLLYTGVNDASHALIRGQAVGFQATLRTELLALDGPAEESDLEFILDEQRDAGLRYLAIIRPDGEVLRVGHSLLVGTNLRETKRLMRNGVPLVRDGRVLVLSRGVRPNRRTIRRRARNAPKRPALIFEFEAVESNELSASSLRSLSIGAGASALLLILAVLLFRWFRRWDRLAKKVSHERRLQSLGQMSAVMAHEIRNPLASLKGNAQVLQMLADKDPDELPSYATKIQEKTSRVVSESLRLEQLVNDLLDFAKTGTITRTSNNPAKILRQCADEIPDNSIKCSCEDAPSEWSFDAPRMQQVLGNLLRNAEAAGTEVSASVYSSSGSLVFSIRDNGPGLGKDPDSLFEPFHTTRTQGTGLGLAVAKRLVELHNGTIDANNRAEGGAELIVRIPKE